MIRALLYTMKYTLSILVIFLLMACGGTLSDEQRKQMREQMEAHRIKRVTTTELTEAAFAKGRSLVAQIENLKTDSARIDSLISGNGMLKYLPIHTIPSHPMEAQLLDAYRAGDANSLQDNVQFIRRDEGSDSILYTKPVVSKNADDSSELEGVWNIWISKKELVLAMKRKK